jgi:glycosyltransferase involved in cell wall biosynthesis
MRILMLAQSYAPVIGGEERMVQDLGRELVTRGHSVAVATLTQESASESDGIRVHTLGSAVYRLPRHFQDSERRHALPGPDPETVRDLGRVMRDERPDVVHAHNWIVHSYAPLRRRTGVPLVLSLHDYAWICATKRLFYRNEQACTGPGLAKCVGCAGTVYGRGSGAALALGMRATVPFTHRAVDAFVPISHAVKDGCRIQRDDYCRVIPNFVRDLPARPQPADPRLAKLPDEPFILFFGDASVDKGAAHLARVYQSLRSPPPLVFVGRCYVDDLRDMPGVVLAGPLPHSLAIEAVRRSLFVTAPSLWAEPFGLVALETAAAGKAIVASDTGGLRDVVRDGETGILVTPGDEPQLAAALTALLSDEQLRDSLGAEAQLRAQDVFSPEVVVPQFESVYDEMAGNSAEPLVAGSRRAI